MNIIYIPPLISAAILIVGVGAIAVKVRRERKKRIAARLASNNCSVDPYV